MSRLSRSRATVELIDCQDACVTLIVPAGLLADLARALDDLTRPGPPAPAPVLPAPEDPRPAYRRRLLKDHDRLLALGVELYAVPRRIAIDLADEGHPWHTVETVRRELNAALKDRRSGEKQ